MLVGINSQDLHQLHIRQSVISLLIPVELYYYINTIHNRTVSTIYSKYNSTITDKTHKVKYFPSKLGMFTEAMSQSWTPFTYISSVVEPKILKQTISSILIYLL